MTVCQYRIVRDIIPGFPNMVFIIQLNVGGEVCMKLCKSQTKHFHSVLKRIVRYAATAKSLQSCPTLCDAIDGSPPGSPVPGILQARTLECGKEINPIENSLSRGLAPGHQQGATETHAFVQ